jgi:hypothetical protein
VTQPNPNPNPGEEQKPAAAKVRRGQVVSYEFHDVVTGREIADGLGVVLGIEDGGNVVVRPLSVETLTLDPANVSPVSAGDVSA